MPVETRITIRRILNANEALCKLLQRNSLQIDKGVSELSKLSGISENFIKLHIDQIRNWI